MAWTPLRTRPTPSSEITSTPRATSASTSGSPRLVLFSPIPSPGADLPSSNVWLEAEERENADSGFGSRDTRSDFSLSDRSSVLRSSLYLGPLSIDIPPAGSPTDAPTSRETMFAALDANFSNYKQWLSFRGRPCIGSRVGQQYCDIVNSLFDSDGSGLVLHSHLLPLLSPADLRRMRLVSRRWMRAVSSFGRLRWKRRRPPLDLVDASDRENSSSELFSDAQSPVKAQCSPRTSVDSPFLRCGALKRTQMAGESEVKKESAHLTPRERFQTASSLLLSSEHLGRCRSCSGPSRISPFDRTSHCAPGGCGAVFCSVCDYPAHGASPCPRRISPTREPPIVPAGSPEKRLRKKLLKRL